MVVGHCFRLVRKDMGASTKRKENQSFSNSGRKWKTLFHGNFKDRVVAIKAKAKSGLLARRSR